MSIEQPKVSVLMPVYNTKEEYLREAIESILNQTFTDFEFIIFNDGSTNNAKEVILSYNDSRIKYYEHENQGIAKTTNKMFKIAKGQYIALMDSDDIQYSNRLQIQTNFLDNNLNIDIISSSYDSIPQGYEYCSIQREIKYLDMIKANQIPNISAMFRIEIIKKFNLYYDETMDISQDYEFWSRAIKHSKCVILPQSLCQYRILQNSNSHANINRLQMYDKIIQQKMLNFLTNDNELQQHICNLIFQNSDKKKLKYNLQEHIFSVKNSSDKKHKIITILGIKIKLKRR